MDGTREEKLNPFEQPPVLQVLFKHIPRNELLKCRLVNRLWYNESLSTCRSNVTIKFEKGVIVPTEDDGFKNTTSLGEFLGLWEAGDWGSYPFKSFHLELWNFNAEDMEHERFMAWVGGHVTSLTLEKCSFSGAENFRRIVYRAFPNLQFLKIDDCKVTDFNDYYEEIPVYKEPAFGLHGLKSLHISNYRPHSMMDLLSHFHKLESLHIKGYLRVGYENLLETIRLIRAQDRTKLPLTNFEVDFELRLGEPDYTASSLERLKLHEQLNLPLQRLEISLLRNMDPNLGHNVMRNILQHHHSTLKYLGLVGDDRHWLPEPFPFGICLDTLEELVIRIGNVPNNLRLNYLRFTPNLRALKLVNYLGDSYSSANLSLLEIEDCRLPSVTDLTFYLPLSIGDLRKLIRCMPNVECLRRIKLNNDKFSMVCKYWKNLKVLQDFGRELTDRGLIGMGSAYEAGDNEGKQRGPNITRLKNLTSFETSSRTLTSASVHEGFLKLGKLKELKLRRSTELDDEAKAALEQRGIKLHIF